ncbi:MAG: flagellin, partial [Alphaproteobacteria bacterium]|nr:flagellin [Alphaproteobacteria bacterium]
MNWNRASAAAVQALHVLTREARQVETRVSTGLKVADPRDNGAVYAIAMGQRSRIASYASIADGISRARGLIDVTFASGSAIADILKQMKVVAGAARSDDLTADQRLALQSDYDALRSQIDRIASSAQFNGASLAAAGGRDLNVNISDSMSSLLVQQIRTANSTPLVGPPQRVSTNSAGDQAVGGDSGNPFVSRDGRFVGFPSWATNLVAGDTNGYQDTFLKDLQTGVVTRISTDSFGQQPIGGSSNSGRFSPDGSFLILTSNATNLVPGDTNGETDLFLKNLQTGEMTRISTDATGQQAVGGST